MSQTINPSIIKKFKSVINHIHDDLKVLEHQISELEIKKSHISKTSTTPDPIGIFKFKKPVELEKYLRKRGYEYLNGRSRS